jgi:hypothetical protein
MIGYCIASFLSGCIIAVLCCTASLMRAGREERLKNR